MKKQNYLSAILMLVVSGACLFSGYWVADLERQKLADTLISSAEGDIRQRNLDTKIKLDLLLALQKGEIEEVKTYLTSSVKNGLKEPPNISDTLRNKGLEYQATYCVDKCLGL